MYHLIMHADHILIGTEYPYFLQNFGTYETAGHDV